jgi:tetratricopeptide (TPR) repeat protein
VRGIFDEIVVVDTGSVDRTREIAREHGANVFEFAWIDDFAAARNAALGHATGDYVFWLDADDVIEPDQREKLQALLDGLRAGDEAAYVVRCACDPGADGSGGETVVDHVRLFPLRAEIRWTYRVHEQILPSLRRAGIPVCWTDLVVRHTGYVDVALRARKLGRDTRILLEELKDRPEEPFILFNLGAIAIERKDWHGALDYLGRSLAHSAPSDSITRKLFALIARAHQMLGDSEAALRVCAEGLAIDAEDAELLFRKAVIHRHRGESGDAAGCWRTILKLQRPEKFASVDMGIYGHLTRRNLAALAAERGDRDEEERLWRDVLAECPGDREALGRLGRLSELSVAPPKPSRISRGNEAPFSVP